MPYSFWMEFDCPQCHADLQQPDSVVCGGNLACVDENGTVSEDGKTDLVLSDPEPVTTCKACSGVLEPRAVEE